METRLRSSEPSSPAVGRRIAPPIALARRLTSAAASAALVATLLFAASASGQELTARQPLPKETVRAQALPSEATAKRAEGRGHRLVVKFRDEVRARSSQGALVSRAAADVRGAEEVAQRYGMSFSPLIRLPEAKLRGLEERAAARSRVAQPDLAGILAVEMPEASTAELEAAGEALQRLPEVEFAYIQQLGAPPPADIPPPTPNLVGFQTYRGPDPGMDADYALGLGFDGTGIRLSDCEYGWVDTHEDLVDRNLHLEPGQTIDPQVAINGWDEHGTAVLGETSGVVNGYGVSGMVPGADVYTFPEWTVEEGFRRVTAITNAIAGSSVGDVVLLEMQTTGPGGGFGPAELDLAVWTVVKAGTDAGVVVVGAAGNGNQNLDSAAYASYRARGDSGAIIVGAGTSDTNHDKLPFSTYGTRVNVQGWGEEVFTLGYGNFAMYGGDPNQSYTDSFSGTSSASPFAASAAVALQDAADHPLTPQNLRALLIATGIPQGSGGHIGPFVNLRAAVDELLANSAPVATDDWFGTLWETPISISFKALLSNDSDPDSDPLTICGLGNPTHGTLGAPAGGAVTYTPPDGCLVNLDSFDYTLCDDLDGVDTGRVWIQIGGIICPGDSDS